MTDPVKISMAEKAKLVERVVKMFDDLKNDGAEHDNDPRILSCLLQYPRNRGGCVVFVMVFKDRHELGGETCGREMAIGTVEW